MHGVFARQGEREFMLSMLEDILGSISGMSSCAYAKTSLYTWDIDLHYAGLVGASDDLDRCRMDGCRVYEKALYRWCHMWEEVLYKWKDGLSIYGDVLYKWMNGFSMCEGLTVGRCECGQRDTAGNDQVEGGLGVRDDPLVWVFGGVCATFIERYFGYDEVFGETSSDHLRLLDIQLVVEVSKDKIKMLPQPSSSGVACGSKANILIMYRFYLEPFLRAQLVPALVDGATKAVSFSGRVSDDSSFAYGGTSLIGYSLRLLIFSPNDVFLMAFEDKKLSLSMEVGTMASCLNPPDGTKIFWIDFGSTQNTMRASLQKLLEVMLMMTGDGTLTVKSVGGWRERGEVSLKEPLCTSDEPLLVIPLRRPPPESELDFVNEPQGWLIVRSRLEDPWFWKAHESERYVECADTPELAAGTTGWCLTATQSKFKLRVGFASGVGGEGWWVEICGCSLGFRDCSSFCSDMSSSQDEA
ncbi:hypothetical protein WN943_003647 [Citrus x changshan-huyou]